MFKHEIYSLQKLESLTPINNLLFHFCVSKKVKFWKRFIKFNQLVHVFLKEKQWKNQLF